MIETNSRRKPKHILQDKECNNQTGKRERRKSEVSKLELTCQTQSFLTTTDATNRAGTDGLIELQINNKQQMIETNSLRKPMSLAVK